MGDGRGSGDDGSVVPPVRPGRPFDHSRDAEILGLTLDLLAERGYEHLTVDEVARRSARAKTTLYRRWPTKEDLVLAAVRAAGSPPELERLPDEGSLRADLLAVIDSDWLGGPSRRMAVFAGLASAARSSVAVATLVRVEVTEPYVAVYAALLHRAVERGLLPADVLSRVPLLAQVIPALSNHGLSVAGGRPVSRDFFVSVVDDVLLPAVGS